MRHGKWFVVDGWGRTAVYFPEYLLISRIALDKEPKKQYNILNMINWSTDEKMFKKKYPKDYKLWRLTQLINFGLDGEKLDKKELKKAWPKIKDRLDPYKKRVLEYLIWGKLYSLPNNLTFWNLSSKSGK